MSRFVIQIDTDADLVTMVGRVETVVQSLKLMDYNTKQMSVMEVENEMDRN